MTGTVNNSSSLNGTLKGQNGRAFTSSFLHQTKSGQVVITFLVLQALLILTANTLVFVLFKKNRFLRTRTNYCLVSLAGSDLLAGAVSLPLVLTCSSTFSWPVCLSMDLCQRFLSISTILHLLAATCERYFKILYPFKYKTVVTRRRVVRMLAGLWLFSCSASLVQLLWIDLSGLTETPRNEFVYSVICLAVLVVLPFSIILGVDGQIFCFIRKERKLRRTRTGGISPYGKKDKRQRKRENERKAVIIYTLMTVTFVFGWFPYFIITLLMDLRLVSADSIPVALSYAFVFMKFGAALVNPLLYTFLKADFRKAFNSLMEQNQPSAVYINNNNPTSSV